MRIYKQQGKTRFNPADDLRDTFSKKKLISYALAMITVPYINLRLIEAIIYGHGM